MSTNTKVDVTRYTFLRRHVQGMILEPAVRPSRQRWPADEILALGNIRKQAKQDAKAAGQPLDEAELIRAASPQSFFHGMREQQGLPDQPVVVPHFPVKVISLEPQRKGATSLTELLDRPLGPGDPPGILLRARSGAGKTVAGWKAFFDCVVPTSVGKFPSQPLLGGWMPCRLTIDPTLPAIHRIKEQATTAAALDETIDNVTDSIVVDLLSVASGLVKLPEAGTSSRGLPMLSRDFEQMRPLIERFLTDGPRLVLLVDLNAVESVERRIVAAALVDFQRRRPRHRCVVTYRTTVEDDPVLRRLRKETGSGPQFAPYDLQPVYEQQAVQYLLNIRRFEDTVRVTLRLPERGRSVPASAPDSVDPIETEVRFLRRMIRDHAARYDSLISTPLLMHWVSSIRLPMDEDELSRWNLTDLYRAVVAQQLDREFQLPIPERLTRQDLLIAMTRVALVLLHRGVTRLTLDDLGAVLEDPADQPDWWPRDAWWHKSKYFQREFGSTDIRPLVEYGLLQHDGAGVGFVHDSLIYYFAGAVALREYRGPGSPSISQNPSDKWAEHVIDRLLTAPALWVNAAEFLGGAWRPRRTSHGMEESALNAQLQRLVLKLVIATPREGMSRLLMKCLSAAGMAGDTVLKHTLQALRWHGGFVHGHPDRLIQEVYNFLAWCESPPDQSRCFAVGLYDQVKANTDPKPTWFRQTYGPPPSQVLTMAEHTESAYALAVLPDGRVVSGGGDGTVKLWNPAAGTVLTIHEHTGIVETVAVLPDGRVVSGSWDNTVKLWDPSSGTVQTMDEHTDTVYTVAVLPDGRVVSGSGDNTVKLWDPAAGTVLTMVEHTYMVSAVALLPPTPDHPGGRVVSGSGVGTVKLWDPLSGKVLTMAEHAGDTAIAVLPNGRVISGSMNNTVKLWDPADGMVLTMDEHTNWVNAVAVFPDGRVVSGSMDQTVKLWDPATGTVQTMDEHIDSVHAVAVLPDGRVVSGSGNGTVKLWDPVVRTVLTMAEHTHWVNAVAVFPDGRVVSGSMDNTVRLCDPTAGTVRTMAKHTDYVTAVAVLPDGRVVSGSRDHTVKLWDPVAGRVRTMAKHKDCISAVAVLRDGRVVSGGYDSTVKLWDPASGTVQTMAGHTRSVCAVVVLPDGRVVSGSEDNSVMSWDPASDKVQWEYAHTAARSGTVFAVAVLPDGCVVSGSSDNNLVHWDPASDEIRSEYVHTRTVLAVAGLADGRVVSGSCDHTVSLWDPVTGSVRTIAEHTDDVTAVAALPPTPDRPGGLVVSGSRDCTVKLWDPATNAVRETFVATSVTCMDVDVRTRDFAVGTRNGLFLFSIEGPASLP